MKTHNISKKQGMTLVELLVYLSITAIVLIVVIDLVTRVVQNRSATYGQGEAVTNGRIFSDKLLYSVQNASAINGSYPADSVSLTISGVAVTYALSGNQIFYNEGAGPIPLTTDRVEILPINVGENIFSKVTNGSVNSIQARFKVKFKENGYFQDFEISALSRGK
ncbi:MAG: hypothetical protein US94_C0008G0009 [Berkelbacteria bacterium GW2011_GWB1_38_5]|uniref:Prepilin-type N-terminal cleavage/methylation domain-containing protein n=2 Tax=Candidatus Berkelbacteria TaxID=1618330 RepID=A0A0G0LHT8_9BACT|nr:MAG: hypothetical protein US94_C0008G0009 [Berkelbacteria bacterium GW2011_GWB1_38_5]KKQ90592.1 MAG: hypothetical protein UT15_C0009G0023 [Berkelbacteria bacterium GW2011_GWA1_39_10]